MTKIERYRKGLYVWKKPYPLYTDNWTEQDFINRIDLTNGWIYTEEELNVQKP